MHTRNTGAHELKTNKTKKKLRRVVSVFVQNTQRVLLLSAHMHVERVLQLAALFALWSVSYIHTHTHTPLYVHTHMYLRAHACAGVDVRGRHGIRVSASCRVPSSKLRVAPLRLRVCVCFFVCRCVRVCACACVFMRAHARANVHTYVHTYNRVCIHTCMLLANIHSHTHINTYVPTYTHAYIRTDTAAKSRWALRALSSTLALWRSRRASTVFFAWLLVALGFPPLFRSPSLPHPFPSSPIPSPSSPPPPPPQPLPPSTVFLKTPEFV